MKAFRFIFTFCVLFTAIFILSGCEGQEKYDDLKLRNRNQQERIDHLESQMNVTKLKLAQAERQLSQAQAVCNSDTEGLKNKVEALEEDVDKKTELIEKMQAQLLSSKGALPPELIVELEEFAVSNEMISFEQASGMVKFNSDLLFEKGSDVVAADAMEPIKKLCEIINSKSGESFDVVIAGHTDDLPIGPATARKHQSNWHLSSHRAISVEKVMETNGVDPNRISVKGYGAYKPLEPNKPNQKGNPKNRRVEIYLVPAGA
ncbi:MAG: OmpA family protein [Sedimentisphaerales bacterium]|nr:OmpA family protein [Sedimentisphaerales bacterium]